MMMSEKNGGPKSTGAGRLAVALALVLVGSAALLPASPLVVVAIPLLVLVGVGGIRGVPTFALTVVAMFFVMIGVPTGTWYVERAWALLAGGAFAALSIVRPGWRLTSRGLVSVVLGVALGGALLTLRSGAWGAVDWSFVDRLTERFLAGLDVLVASQGGSVPDATRAAWMQTLESTVHVYPAFLVLETLAGLALSWWIYLRVVRKRSDGLGSLRDFRFNDHLVWILVAGLLLVVARAGTGLARFGANAVVVMTALYALRGLGVFVHLNGGLSILAGTLLAGLLLVLPPVVIGFTTLLGITDTWLDLRKRMAELA